MTAGGNEDETVVSPAAEARGERLAMILDQSFNIQSRAGLHCAPLAHQTLGTFDSGGAVRFSPGVFTTDEEITAAIDAVRQIANS